MAEGKSSAIQTYHCSLWRCHCEPPFTNCLWQ